MKEVDLVRAVVRVMARRAGWYQPRREGLPQPRSRVLNNPLLLNAWRRTPSGTLEDTGLFEGYETVADGFIKFDDASEGWHEAHKNIKARIGWQKVTARRLFLTRDDSEYLASLTRQLNITPDQVLADLITEVPRAQRGNTRVAARPNRKG